MSRPRTTLTSQKGLMEHFTEAEISNALARARAKREGRWQDEPHTTSANGVVRSDQVGKPDYTLLDWDAIERWAIHMTKAVPSKGHNNWRNAGPEDEQRFIQSFWRHAVAWARGDTDEDHGSALFYNIAGREYARGRR